MIKQCEIHYTKGKDWIFGKLYQFCGLDSNISLKRYPTSEFLNEKALKEQNTQISPFPLGPCFKADSHSCAALLSSDSTMGLSFIWVTPLRESDREW